MVDYILNIKRGILNKKTIIRKQTTPNLCGENLLIKNIHYQKESSRMY